MLKGVKEISSPDFRGGLVTTPNLLSLLPNQTPNAMNVKFNIGGEMEKRLGSNTVNATVLVSSAATGFSPDTNGTLSTGLQAFWKLDEQSGTRADEFGTNNLVSNNNVGFATGILSNAGSFAFANSMYLSVAHNAALSVGNQDWTVASWVYADTEVAANQRAIVSKSDASPNGGWTVLWDGADGTKRYRLQIADSGFVNDVNVYTLANPATATWYLITAWNSLGVAGSAWAYIQFNTAAAASASYTFTPSATSGAFEIGRRARNDLNPWSGRIDEVGFWKKVLTAQERTDLFNAGAANTYSKGASNSGFGSFDFGAGFAGGEPLRWLVVSAGTGVYASSNRGVTFVVIGTDRRTNYQEFTRSKSWLIATSETMNKVLIWPGSVGTFMVNNTAMPPSKHALDFAGFLLLINDSGGRRRVVYGPNATLNTDPFDDEFELPSSQDDETTGGVVYNGKAYLSTKYKMFKVSHVGGNPDFITREVANFGAVPRTIKVVTIPQLGGEVITCLGWDKKLRIYDGTEYRVVSDNVEFNNGQSPFSMNDINTTAIQKSHAEYDSNEQVYKLWVAIQPSTEMTHCVCLNLRTLGMYTYDNQGFNSVVMAESGNYRNLFGIKRDGYVEQIDSSNLDRSTAINAFYESPYLYSKTPGSISKSQKLDIYLSVRSSGALYFQERTDFRNIFKTREVFSFADTSGVTQLRKTINIPATQNVYQWKITDSSSTASPWAINRIDYDISDFGIGRA